MKRAFKIILILLLVIALLLFGAWLRVRKQSTDQGRSAPTFREFLGLGSRAPSTTTDGGTGLTPDGPSQGGETPNTETPSQPSTTGGVAVSQFTSGPLTPAQGASGGPGFGMSGSGSGSSGGNTSSGGAAPTPPQAPAAGTTGPFCGEEDLNIDFTADEIARLNALQNRFYAIAGSLNSDADIQQEASNYTTYKAKADQITELYNYCVATAGATGGATALSGVFNGGALDPREVLGTQAIIQRIFKVNLW
jgi:hypothetical protein